MTRSRLSELEYLRRRVTALEAERAGMVKAFTDPAALAAYQASAAASAARRLTCAEVEAHADELADCFEEWPCVEGFAALMERICGERGKATVEEQA